VLIGRSFVSESLGVAVRQRVAIKIGVRKIELRAKPHPKETSSAYIASIILCSESPVMPTPDRAALIRR